MKAKQRGRPVESLGLDDILKAMDQLRRARYLLRAAGSHNSANYVQRALKSAQGAYNNAQAHLSRQAREPK